MRTCEERNQNFDRSTSCPWDFPFPKVAAANSSAVSKQTTLLVADIKVNRFPPGAGKGYIRASQGAFWKYERLPEIRGIPQTRVTYTQQVDLKGFIPSFVMNSKIVGTLGYLSIMRKKFDKSLEIDAGCRAAIVQQIKQLAKVRSFEERSARSVATVWLH